MLDRIMLYDIPANTVFWYGHDIFVPAGLYHGQLFPHSVVIMRLSPLEQQCPRTCLPIHASVNLTDVPRFAVTFVREKPMEQPLDPPAKPKVPTSIEDASSALRNLQNVAMPLHEEGRLRRDQVVSWRLSLSVIESLLEEAD